MNIILNAIVLIFEVLYYALFMKFARKDGKFWKYILLFSLITIISGFLGTNQLISYFLLILMIIYGIKYVVKIKVKLFDILIILIMLLFKLVIEIPIYFILSNFTNMYLTAIASGIIKVFALISVQRKIEKIYKYLYELWSNNNFYIRYIFSTFLFIYCICSCLFIILYYIN